MTVLDENSLEDSSIVWYKSMGYPVLPSAPSLTWAGNETGSLASNANCIPRTFNFNQTVV